MQSNYEGCQTVDCTESMNVWYQSVIIEILKEADQLELKGKKVVPKRLKCLQLCHGSAKAANQWYQWAMDAKLRYTIYLAVEAEKRIKESQTTSQS
jgi:hypothetical protein